MSLDVPSPARGAVSTRGFDGHWKTIPFGLFFDVNQDLQAEPGAGTLDWTGT